MSFVSPAAEKRGSQQRRTAARRAQLLPSCGTVLPWMRSSFGNMQLCNKCWNQAKELFDLRQALPEAWQSNPTCIRQWKPMTIWKGFGT